MLKEVLILFEENCLKLYVREFQSREYNVFTHDYLPRHHDTPQRSLTLNEVNYLDDYHHIEGFNCVLVPLLVFQKTPIDADYQLVAAICPLDYDMEFHTYINIYESRVRILEMSAEGIVRLPRNEDSDAAEQTIDICVKPETTLSCYYPPSYSDCSHKPFDESDNTAWVMWTAAMTYVAKRFGVDRQYVEILEPSEGMYIHFKYKGTEYCEIAGKIYILKDDIKFEVDGIKL